MSARKFRHEDGTGRKRSAREREARYAEAICHAAREMVPETRPEDWADEARAVMAVADAELASLTAERDEARQRIWQQEDMLGFARLEVHERLGQLVLEKRASEAEVRDLRAKVAAVEALHVPWYEVNGTRHDHVVPVYGAPPKDHVCRVGFTTYDNCLIDPECPEESEHYVLACSECRCATDEGQEGYLFWPCATVRALASVGRTEPAPSECCGHVHTPDGCSGPPTPSDVWAGVSPSVCDCDGPEAGRTEPEGAGALCRCGHTKASHAPGECVGCIGPDCEAVACGSCGLTDAPTDRFHVCPPEQDGE